jgi:hypothetical protein
MKGQGAIVFLIVFFAMLAATLAAPTIPPGRAIYDLLGVPDTDYPVLGIPTTTLVIAVFNGVVYGIIAWLIFTFGRKILKPT